MLKKIFPGKAFPAVLVLAGIVFFLMFIPSGFLIAQPVIPGFYIPSGIAGPKIVPGTQKAVYLTGYGSMGNKSKRQQIYEMIDKTEINSIVFDVKDDRGYIDYNCTIPAVVSTGAVKNYYDLDEVLSEFKERNIYSIARFVTFKDDILPRARNDFAILNKNTGKPISLEGSTWVDIYCQQAWDYYITIITDLAAHGVDEIQFDYIRAPSRGNIASALYSHNEDGHDKVWAIKNFLARVQRETEPYNIKISADVFGWVFITENDQGIGQLIEEMAPQLDYIYPMAYPSHYNVHFMGFADAEAHPYEVMKYTLEKGFERIGDTSCLIIPWVQAFSYDLHYSEAEILAQVNAAEDLGIKGFLFWNAANKYSTVESALISRK
jgi:hypothetical protein